MGGGGAVRASVWRGAKVEALEGRALLSTVNMVAPDGTDQGGLLRQAIDSALRGSGDAVVNLQAGTYITNPSQRDWTFGVQSDFDKMWQVSGGTAVVDAVNKVLVITPTVGATSVNIQIRDTAALGIASTGSPNLLTQFTAVSSGTTYDLQTRAMGTTNYVSRATGTLATGTANVAFGYTSGTALVVNNLKYVFNKTAGFVSGDVIKVSSMKIRLDETWAYAGLGPNDLAEQHVIGLDMSYITNKSLTLSGPSDASRATLMTQLPFSDFFNVGDFNDLTVQNVNFDYQNRPWVQANIVAVNTAANQVTVTLDSALDLTRMRDPNWYSLIADGVDPSTSTLWATARGLDAANPGRMALGIGQNTKVYFNQSDSFAGTSSYSSSKTYVMQLDSAAGYQAGMHMTWTSRNGGYSICRFSGNNLTMRNVQVFKGAGTMVSSFGAGATGVTVNGTLTYGGKFVFDNVKLAPADVDRDVQWITQPADGIHINSPYYVSTGTNDYSIYINNCRIESNNDDSIAIYQSGGQVTAVSGNKLTVSMPYLPKVGDTIAVIGDPGYLRGTATVTAVSGSVLTLSATIPGVVASANTITADYVFNMTRSAQNSYLGNTVFQDPRGNGLKTRMGSWVVENNTFTRLGWSAVSLGTEINGNNTSGPYPSDVVIRNNVMDSCNFSDSSNQLLNGTIEAGMMTKSGAKPYQDRIIRNISIVSNTITGVARAGINLTSCETVTITGNTITARLSDPTPGDHTGPVVFDNVRYATLTNNTITEARATAEAAVNVDPLYNLNWYTTKNFDGTPTMLPSSIPVMTGNTISTPAGIPGMRVGSFTDTFTGASQGDYFGVTAQTPTSFSVPTTGTYANQLVFSGTTLEGIYRRYGVYGDVKVSASVNIVQNYSSDGSGVIFRATNSGAHPNYQLTSFYWLAIDPTAGVLKLVRRDGSVNAGGTLSYTQSVLTTVAVTGGVVLGATYRMTARAVGNQLSGAVTNATTGAVTTVSYTDGSANAIYWGGIGVRTNGTNAAVSGTKTVYDDLYVQANVAPSVPAAPVFSQGSGLSGSFSAVGVDDDPEPTLVYTWSKVSGPGSAVFSGNGTNAAKNATVTVSAAGSYVFSVLVTDVNGQSTATNVGVVIALPAPKLTGFVVDDGSRQRSMIRTLTVRFDQAVTLGGGALTLTKRVTGGGSVTIPFTVSPGSGAAASFVLSFGANGYVGNSLTDGVYDLQVTAAAITANGQGLATGNQTLSFVRIFGDMDGNGAVNNSDMLLFRKSYPAAGGTGGYLWYFDYDQDGTINLLDYQAIMARYGRSYTV
jgi:hypothetical protein